MSKHLRELHGSLNGASSQDFINMGMPAELRFKGGSDSKICFEIAVFLFSNFLLEVLPESFSQKKIHDIFCVLEQFHGALAC